MMYVLYASTGCSYAVRMSQFSTMSAAACCEIHPGMAEADVNVLRKVRICLGDLSAWDELWP